MNYDNRTTTVATKARMRLVLDARFWAMLSLRLNLIPDPSIETAATDAKSMWYNPEWFDSLTLREQEGVIAHETVHCALGHPFRLGGRDHELANDAMDHVVNLLLIAAGYTLPQPHLADPRFTNMAWEKVYAILSREEAAKQKLQPKPEKAEPTIPGPEDIGMDPTHPDEPTDGDSDDQDGNGTPEPGKPSAKGGGDAKDDPAQTPSQGKGTGDPKPGNETPGQPGSGPGGSAKPQKPTNWGSVREPSPETVTDPETGEAVPGPTPDELAEDWQKALETAVMVGQKAGDLPGYLTRAIDEAKQPVEDLSGVLQRYFFAKDNQSYATPNKKFLARDLRLPGRFRSRLQEVVVAVDTSGSIDNRLLRYFRDTLNEVLSMDEAPERITVIYCDTAVRKVDEYTEGQVEFNPVGGGGTAFRPVFDHIEREGLRPDVMMFFTDLENPYGEKLEEPDYPTLWVAPIQSTRTPAFGECVRVDPYQQ